MTIEATFLGESSTSIHDRRLATVSHLDRIEVDETFADSISRVIFDGQLRIEFSVTRFDERKPNSPITGRRYPVSRLVLALPATVELINRMQQLAGALTQAGAIKAALGPLTETANADLNQQAP
jgi:hypothetical protein